jgi:spore maturation protein CgeB
MACGLALLVCDLSDWKEMYVEPGYSLACNIDDPEDIVTVLQWYLTHPKEMRVMGEAGRRRNLDEWNYEYQFAPVMDLLTNN